MDLRLFIDMIYSTQWSPNNSILCEVISLPLSLEMQTIIWKSIAFASEMSTPESYV